MKHLVRSTVAAIAVTLGVSVLAPASPAAAVGDLSTIDLGLTPVATGLNQPLALAWRAGDPDMYVAEQTGKVRRVVNGTLLKGAVLKVKTKSQGERGLLGLTFGPDGSTLYVNYTGIRDGHTRVDAYPMNAKLKKAVKRFGRTVLLRTQPFANHNGGTIAFGPDNLLYIALGDGGSGGDPQNNAQNKNTLLGKILRINPTPANGYQYSIPLGNPFVGQPGARWEVWSYGLRNPWKFSFDQVTGDMWIGDVGQSAYEEINFAPAGSSGQNWGWRLREGAHPYLGGAQPPGGVDPVIERPHTAGDCSITGGYVYRGTAIPALQGAYLYGDYCTGKIYAAEQQGGTIVQNEELDISVPPFRLTSFGQDPNGEVYAVTRSGTIYRITAG